MKGISVRSSPLEISRSSVHTLQQFWLSSSLSNSHFAPFAWCRCFFWQAHCFGNMLTVHMFLFFFFLLGDQRCVEWDWKIDFSHTVALLCEVENTSGADACLFHSAAALSLRFILPYTAHCALVTHSFFSPPLSHLQSGWSQRPQWRFPWVLTSATRHKQPTSSCGKTTWHQTGCFFPPP